MAILAYILNYMHLILIKLGTINYLPNIDSSTSKTHNHSWFIVAALLEVSLCCTIWRRILTTKIPFSPQKANKTAIHTIHFYSYEYFYLKLVRRCQIQCSSPPRSIVTVFRKFISKNTCFHPKSM